VLRQFARKNKPNRSLDFPRGDSRLLIVSSESRRFLSELLEDIIDEAVHDAHGLAGDSNVRVNLLEDLEDVDLVGLNALLHLLLLLVAGAGLLRELFAGLWLLLRRSLLLYRLFLGGLLLCLGRH